VERDVASGGLIGVPPVHRRLLHLVAHDPAGVLAGRPRPHRLAGVGRSKRPHEPCGPGAQLGEQFRVVGGTVGTGYARRVPHPPGDDRRPELLHLQQVPHEVGDRPAGAPGYRQCEPAIGGSGEGEGVALYALERVEVDRESVRGAVIAHASNRNGGH
jgi:hypothetical protein